MKGAKLLQGSAFVGTLIAISSVSVNPVLAVPLTNAGYSQDFDTLANFGLSSTLPDDWEFIELGSVANTTYGAGTGSSTGGNTYSFGADGSAERALGGLRTGTAIPTFGVHFENGGSTAINSLAVSYTGEQWRLGSLGRVDRLDFQYSLDATSLTTGSWTDLDTLDFSTPNLSGTGAKDGNQSANRTPLSGTIGGLSLAPLDTIWLRWLDFDASGADDGLAIDDFGIDAVFADPPRPTGAVPDAGSSLGFLGIALAALGVDRCRRGRAGCIGSAPV